MTEQPALFDGFTPEEPEPQTAGDRRRARHAARILSGWHPLSFGGRRIPLHPAATRVTEPDGKGMTAEFRCGTCRFRVLMGGHAKDFPKCIFGRVTVPVPVRLRYPNGPTTRTTTPRATGSEDSDVRAWWPACKDWQPHPPKEDA